MEEKNFLRFHSFYPTFIIGPLLDDLFPMSEPIEGFCLKCKTYGPITGPTPIKMKNGRTRVAGTCSQPGCTGKISKIVS
jgi:hypothetical protein